MTDLGDWRTPTLTVTPFDGSTAAALEIEAPDGTTTTQTPTTADGGVTWAGQAYQLTAAGEWVERWTVTGTGASAQRATVLVAPDPATAPTGQRSYATTADLAIWLGKAPPADARQSLAAASRIVDRLLFTAVYDVDPDTGLPTDPAVVEALRDATCAQAQFAQAAGDPAGVGAGRITQGRIGSVSFTRGDPAGGPAPGRAAAQSVEILTRAGLIGHGPWGW